MTSARRQMTEYLSGTRNFEITVDHEQHMFTVYDNTMGSFMTLSAYDMTILANEMQRIASKYQEWI